MEEIKQGNSRILKFRAWDKVKKVMRDNVSTGTVDIWGGELGFDNDSESKNCEFMQFTGLLDRHGKEIYEGDIIRTEQITEYGRGYLDEEVYFGGGAFYPISTQPEETWEVIGNIYEKEKTT